MKSAILRRAGNFLKSVWASSTKFSSYESLYSEDLGKSLRYFFLVILLGVALSFVVIAPAIMLLPQMIEQGVPDFRIENGVLTVDAAQPIVFTARDNSTFVVDTTGGTSSFEAGIEEGVLVTATQLKYKAKGAELEVVELSEVEKSFDFMKSRKGLQDKVISVTPYLIPLAFVLLYLSNLTMYLFIALSVSILTCASVLVLGTRMRYANVLKVACRAMTPMILLSSVPEFVAMSFVGMLWSTAMFSLVIKKVYRL